jgi:hypothetical protein
MQTECYLGALNLSPYVIALKIEASMLEKSKRGYLQFRRLPKAEAQILFERLESIEYLNARESIATPLYFRYEQTILMLPTVWDGGLELYPAMEIHNNGFYSSMGIDDSRSDIFYAFVWRDEQ